MRLLWTTCRGYNQSGTQDSIGQERDKSMDGISMAKAVSPELQGSGVMAGQTRTQDANDAFAVLLRDGASSAGTAETARTADTGSTSRTSGTGTEKAHSGNERTEKPGTKSRAADRADRDTDITDTAEANGQPLSAEVDSELNLLASMIGGLKSDTGEIQHTASGVDAAAAEAGNVVQALSGTQTAPADAAGVSTGNGTESAARQINTVFSAEEQRTAAAAALQEDTGHAASGAAPQTDAAGMPQDLRTVSGQIPPGSPASTDAASDGLTVRTDADAGRTAAKAQPDSAGTSPLGTDESARESVTQAQTSRIARKSAGKQTAGAEKTGNASGSGLQSLQAAHPAGTAGEAGAAAEEVLSTTPDTAAEDLAKYLASKSPFTQSGRLSLIFEPRSLGRIAIEVTVNGGKAAVAIAASNPSTLQMLTQNADEIARILQKHTGQQTEIILAPQAQEHQQAQTADSESSNRQTTEEQQERAAQTARRKAEESDSFLHRMRLGLA